MSKISVYSVALSVPFIGTKGPDQTMRKMAGMFSVQCVRLMIITVEYCRIIWESPVLFSGTLRLLSLKLAFSSKLAVGRDASLKHRQRVHALVTVFDAFEPEIIPDVINTTD